MSEKKLTVGQTAVIAMLVEMGMLGATAYNAARCAGKIKTLPSIIDDCPKPKDAAAKALLKKILAALEEGKEVEVEEEAEPAKPAKGGKGKAKKPTKKEAAAESDEDEEEEEEDAEDEEGEDEESDEDDSEEEDDSEGEEDEADEEEEDDEEAEDEDEEEAPAKSKAKAKGKKGKTTKSGKPFKKAGGGSGPGVIASIMEFLAEGSKDTPVTKATIHKKMLKRFPDRDSESTMSTINTQIPNKLSKEKGLVIKKNDEGYWIANKSILKSVGKAAPKAEKPAPKGKGKPAKANAK